MDYNDEGVWKNLIVKTTLDDKRMAVIVINHEKLEEKDILKLMDDLRKYFLEGNGASCNLDSLYLCLR